MNNKKTVSKSSSPGEAMVNNNETGILMKGIGVSAGIGIGQVIVLERLTTSIYPKKMIEPDEVPQEIDRFESAVHQAANQLMEIKSQIDGGHPLRDHLYILDTHLMLLKERMFFAGTKNAIASERQNAEWALSEIIRQINTAFETIEDEYLKERARDINFVGERVLRILMGRAQDKAIHQLPPNSVIVAHEMSPAETAQIARDSVIGFATDMGGRTSHTAIMARSLKIPAVTGLEKLSRRVQTGDTIIVDGMTGVVIVNPDPDQIFRYRERQESFRSYQTSLLGFGRLPAITNDGIRTVRITANLELPDESEIAVQHGAEGVGLFRTEYLFLGRPDLPSEQEQYEVYCSILEENAPNPVTIRTLDAGGDKFATHLNVANETNPALGLRAIRLCLQRPELFETQLRAILRASIHGNCKLLIPMISCLSELHTTKEILEKVKNDLRNSGQEFNPELKLGLLLEVPSAVAIADLLAREVDFFSIGTNDLIQYAMAIDRVNEHVNYLYNTLHPGVLRLIRQISTVGRTMGIPVSMCGEMAGDPLNIPILLSLEFEELSMNPLSIPMVKKLIRSVSMDECEELTKKAYQLQTSHDIHNLLESWIRERFPEDYFVDRS